MLTTGETNASQPALYASFTSAPTISVLTDISLKMMISPNYSINSVNVGLYTDAGLNPGSLIGAYIGVISDGDTSIPLNPTPGGYKNVLLTPAAPLQLSAATRYWIGVTYPAGPANLYWAYAAPATPDVTSEYHNNGVTTTQNSADNRAYQMQVNTSAVPEPSTYLLLTLSLGLVGYARRRMSMS
jgi:PEP-CTERM motif